MTFNREECFRRLAPEVKDFLDASNQIDLPPLSLETYKLFRQFYKAGVKKEDWTTRFKGKIEDRTFPGPEGEVAVRIYTPEGNGPFPILLYFHGGAWVMGNLFDADDPQCVFWAREIPCLVISVDYRLAPEHPYPAARNDCYATLQWVAEKGNTIGGDPERIAVAGDSAGGNLATVMALMTKKRGGPSLCFQLLVYPSTTLADDTWESYQNFGDGFMLRRVDLEGAKALYLPNKKDWTDPYASPLLAQDLSGLPPALIITAGCDPLRDEGKAYAKRLTEAGGSVESICYEDMIHAFLSFFKSSESTMKALKASSTALRKAFGA